MTHALFAVPVILTLVAAGCRNEPGRPASNRPVAPASASALPAGSASESEPSRPPTSMRVVVPNGRRLALGGNHSCFIDAREKLWCWGSNDLGEIGNGEHGWRGRSEDTDEAARIVKRPFSGYPFERARAVFATGGETCAIAQREAWCWGGLGDEPMSVIDRPVHLSQLPGLVQDLALSAHHCGIQQGRLFCWGDNRSAAVGKGERVEAAPPRVIEELGAGVLGVATSVATTCAISADHSVWCWGGNDFGELGRPKSAADPRPGRVGGVSASMLTAGTNHFCAVDPEGRVHCWGANWDGQLGSASAGGDAGIRAVGLRGKAVSIAVSASASLAVLENGDVYGWGQSKLGLLGAIGPDGAADPVAVSGLTRVVQIAAGQMHACALTEDESVWCWGQGDDYQLGHGKDEDSATPVRVMFPGGKPSP